MNFALTHGYVPAQDPRVLGVAGAPRGYAKRKELPCDNKKSPAHCLRGLNEIEPNATSFGNVA